MSGIETTKILYSRLLVKRIIIILFLVNKTRPQVGNDEKWAKKTSFDKIMVKYMNLNYKRRLKNCV